MAQAAKAGIGIGRRALVCTAALTLAVAAAAATGCSGAADTGQDGTPPQSDSQEVSPEAGSEASGDDAGGDAGTASENGADNDETAALLAEGAAKEAASGDGGSATESEQAGSEQAETEGETPALTETQQNSINMLNYLSALVQDINSSHDSRIRLEEAYDGLVSNIQPEAVDESTRWQLMGVLDTLESYRMIDVKRDRLEYVYEQNKALAAKEAVPEPLIVLTAVQTGGNPLGVLATALYAAYDSKTSYETALSQAELQYLQDGWQLDDDEAEALHESRKSLFSYMIQMVQDYDLPGDLALSESAVDEFVSWKENGNVTRRIQFLESNQGAYAEFGEYWLTLAQSYYEDGDWEKCLDAVRSYEGLSNEIFRKDEDYARTLALAVSAAEQLMGSDEFAAYASACDDAILSNCDNSDWDLRYFVAQTELDLYARTGDRAHLQKCYDVTLDTVNYLIDEQEGQNGEYLSGPAWLEITEGMSESQRQERDAYNKSLEARRATQLPPVYQPLVTNLDLLFAVADQLGIDEAEQAKIEGMLHPGGERLFLVDGLDERYSFASEGDEADGGSSGTAGSASGEGISLKPGELSVPARLLCDGSSIKVEVLGEDGSLVQSFEDWGINRVEHGADGDLGSVVAVYTSDAAKQLDYRPGMSIRVTVSTWPDEGLAGTTAGFKVVSTKDSIVEKAMFWDKGVAIVDAGDAE